MRKIRHYVRHVLMHVGMFAERCWDETKKFVWWLFAPNAYADLVYDYRALQRGYEELKHTWYVDGEHDAKEIRELQEEKEKVKDEIEKLKEENAKLKAANDKLTERLAEIVTRYEMAMDEGTPAQFPPHLLYFET